MRTSGRVSPVLSPKSMAPNMRASRAAVRREDSVRGHRHKTKRLSTLRFESGPLLLKKDELEVFGKGPMSKNGVLGVPYGKR